MTWDMVKDTVQWAGQIIVAGKPAASLPKQMANAVPDVDDWQALTDARGPQETPWNIVYTNGFGIDVVKVKLQLNFDYGARYKGGGAFITNVWVEVFQCDVKWGYSVDLSFSPQKPENAASFGQPTHARLPCTVWGSVSTPFWTDNMQWGFTLFGDAHTEVQQG